MWIRPCHLILKVRILSHDVFAGSRHIEMHDSETDSQRKKKKRRKQKAKSMLFNRRSGVRDTSQCRRLAKLSKLKKTKADCFVYEFNVTHPRPLCLSCLLCIYGPLSSVSLLVYLSLSIQSAHLCIFSVAAYSFCICSVSVILQTDFSCKYMGMNIPISGFGATHRLDIKILSDSTSPGTLKDVIIIS